MMSIELTKDEAREILLTEIWEEIAYWENVDGRACREKLQGLAFSILATLDGCTVGVPEFSIVPMDGIENIGGSLHEVFYSYKPERSNDEKSLFGW